MFIQNNKGFVCVQCGREVEKHKTSSRNHCNWCLVSMHVDNEPGDRKNTCQGVMTPIGLEMKSGKTQILHKCETCGFIGKNIVADDDNEDMLVQLSGESIQNIQ